MSSVSPVCCNYLHETLGGCFKHRSVFFSFSCGRVFMTQAARPTDRQSDMNSFWLTESQTMHENVLWETKISTNLFMRLFKCSTQTYIWTWTCTSENLWVTHKIRRERGEHLHKLCLRIRSSALKLSVKICSMSHLRWASVINQTKKKKKIWFFVWWRAPKKAVYVIIVVQFVSLVFTVVQVKCDYHSFTSFWFLSETKNRTVEIPPEIWFS